jgi:hypothetical protein
MEVRRGQTGKRLLDTKNFTLMTHKAIALRPINLLNSLFAALIALTPNHPTPTLAQKSRKNL